MGCYLPVHASLKWNLQLAESDTDPNGNNIFSSKKGTQQKSKCPPPQNPRKAPFCYCLAAKSEGAIIA